MTNISQGKLISGFSHIITNLQDLSTITDFISNEMNDYRDMIVQADLKFMNAYYPWTLYIHKNIEKSKYFMTIINNEFPFFDVDVTNETWKISSTYEKDCKDLTILEIFNQLYDEIDPDFQSATRFHSNDLDSLSKTLSAFFTIDYDYNDNWEKSDEKDGTVYILYKR